MYLRLLEEALAFQNPNLILNCQPIKGLVEKKRNFFGTNVIKTKYLFELL